jgi:hypothetical protein
VVLFFEQVQLKLGWKIAKRRKFEYLDVSLNNEKEAYIQTYIITYNENSTYIISNIYTTATVQLNSATRCNWKNERLFESLDNNL